MASVKEFVDEIIADGIITSEEHEQFMALVHADGQIDEEESEQISRIFRLVSEGKVTIVDETRESADRQALEEAKKAAIQADIEYEEERKKAAQRQETEEEALKRKNAIQAAIGKVTKEQSERRNKVAEFFEERKRRRG